MTSMVFHLSGKPNLRARSRLYLNAKEYKAARLLLQYKEGGWRVLVEGERWEVSRLGGVVHNILNPMIEGRPISNLH